MHTARDIEDTIIGMADEKQAAILKYFFKTGKGQYGEGDCFLGVKNPQVRAVVKEAWRDATVSDAVTLAHSKWHEVRLCGLLILVEKFAKANKRNAGITEQMSEEEIFNIYLSLHPYINNWDLVDLTAAKIAGAYELKHPYITILDQWIKPGHTLWQRRISIVSTWMSIRNGLYDKALERAEDLLDSREDLLHKAAGWMLREVWKRGGMEEVEYFLDRNVERMPSVMLSYTCEKMAPQHRTYWRERRRNHKS